MEVFCHEGVYEKREEGVYEDKVDEVAVYVVWHCVSREF